MNLTDYIKHWLAMFEKAEAANNRAECIRLIRVLQEALSDTMAD